MGVKKNETYLTESVYASFEWMVYSASHTA
jgi:hypothetical protein